MQEMMIAGGSGAYYPWSGPGNKKLMRGTRDLGYFGTVSTAELYTDKSLGAIVGVNPQFGIFNTVPDKQVWYKFIYRGRIIYLARYATLRNVSYQDIYNAGAVYGVRGPGDGTPPASGPVDQFKVLTKYERINGVPKLWPLKVSLIQGANDGVFPSGSTWDSDQSEWDVIWKKFFAEKWDPLATWADMSFNDPQWNFVKERSSDGLYAALRGGSTSTYEGKARTQYTNYSSYVWRPKIELVTDPNVALEVQYVNFKPGGGLGIPLMSLENTEQNPVRTVVDVTIRNGALLMPMVSFLTMDPQIYLNPSSGGELLTTTLATEDALLSITDVRRTNPSRMPAYSAQVGHEEVFAVVPDAQIRITASVGIEDANVQSPAKIVAITNTQTGNIAYAYRNYEPRVYQTTPVKIAFDSPTFTIEPDA